MEKQTSCPFSWISSSLSNKWEKILWKIKDTLWILLLASSKPTPKSEDDIKYKEKIYNHYRKISDSLLEYIISIWWFEVFFWDKDINEKLIFKPTEENIKEIFSFFFSHSRNVSISHVKTFFTNNPDFLNPEFNTTRYEVWDRFERSASNVHFVVLLYIYCYLKQYKDVNWNFPILDDEKINILLKNAKIFSLQMAKNLEMWLQMSFLRTIFWTPYQEWLLNAIRHGNIILPEDWWKRWVKLSSDNLYLEINNDLLSETIKRVEIALEQNQIPNAWNVQWCPAFPKFIVWALNHIENDLKIILKNFNDENITSN